VPVTVGNKTLRNGRRPSTPTGGASLAGAGTVKPMTRCHDDLSAGQAGRLLLVQERTSANTPAVTYTRGRDLSGSLDGAGGIGGLLARSHGYSGGNWSSHTAYHADGNGNVTALANSAGALQASYRYDPYGRYLAGGGTLASANVMRFSSKPWAGFAGSATSGLYYYGYRFYDPYLQRWLNRDPINEPGFNLLIQSQTPFNLDEEKNLYAFVHNDPLNKIDPDGRWAAIVREALKRAAPHLEKCKNLRCKVALHGPHHSFPGLGKKCHIQVTCWVKGSKGSGVNLRIPVPDFMCPKKKPPTTPGAPPASPPARDAGGEELGEVEIE